MARGHDAIGQKNALAWGSKISAGKGKGGIQYYLRYRPKRWLGQKKECSALGEGGHGDHTCARVLEIGFVTMAMQD